MQNGVKLKYNTKVTDISKNEVKTENGSTFTADHIVVATGPFTGDTFKVEHPDIVTIEEEYYELLDKTGLPDIFVESSEAGQFNGCLNEENLEHYKFCLMENKNYEKVCNWVKHRIPSKAEEVINNPKSHQCKWCYAKDQPFIYRTEDDGVHYAYGFSGYGFAEMPLHGQIVYDTLINNKPFKYNEK